MNGIRLYGEFSKVQQRDDGTIVVSGIASSEAVDSDGETILGSAIKAALPSYMKFPAVREMHQPLAAGTMLAAEVGDDGKTYVEAHIVDPVAVKKVKAGVYRGFSIGGRVAPGGRDATNPKVIKRLSLSEISLVDRPANPEATFQIVKLDTGPDGEPAEKGDSPGHPFRGNQHSDGEGGGAVHPGAKDNKLKPAASDIAGVDGSVIADHDRRATQAHSSEEHATAEQHHRAVADHHAKAGNQNIASAHAAAADAHGQALRQRLNQRGQATRAGAHDASLVAREASLRASDARDPSSQGKPRRAEGKYPPLRGRDALAYRNIDSSKAEQPGDVLKGDSPGHPFRGNQHSDGEGGGGGVIGSGDEMIHFQGSRAQAGMDALEAASEGAHLQAAHAHGAAAKQARAAGRGMVARFHAAAKEAHTHAAIARTNPAATATESRAASRAARGSSMAAFRASAGAKKNTPPAPSVAARLPGKAEQPTITKGSTEMPEPTTPAEPIEPATTSAGDVAPPAVPTPVEGDSPAEVPVEKKGARFSASTKESLAQLRAIVQMASAAITDLGFDDPDETDGDEGVPMEPGSGDEGIGKPNGDDGLVPARAGTIKPSEAPAAAANTAGGETQHGSGGTEAGATLNGGKAAGASDDLRKLAEERGDALRKLETENTSLRKLAEKHAADAADALAKVASVTTERDSLKKALAEATAALDARPKGALKSVPVEKGADTGRDVASEPEPQDAVGLIRKAHKAPFTLR